VVAAGLSSSSIMPWMLRGRKILAFTQPTDECRFMLKMALVVKGKGKVHPCTGTEALYRPYGP